MDCFFPVQMAIKRMNKGNIFADDVDNTKNDFRLEELDADRRALHILSIDINIICH